MGSSRRTTAVCVALVVIAICALGRQTGATAGLAITAISGTIAHGSSLTLTGVNFGTKPTAAPRKFDSFETGSNGALLSGWTIDNTYPPTYSNQIVRPNSVMSARSNFINGTWASNFGITGEQMPRVYFDAWYYYDAVPPYSRNHKVFRFHANRVGQPNLYFNLYCANNGTHLSQDGVNGGHFDVWPALGPEDFAGRWSHLQGYFIQSSPGVDDGTAIFWVNGVKAANEIGNFRTRNLSTEFWDTLWFGNFLDHGSDGNCAAYPQDAFTYWDDVYVDYTPARVEIGDASTYANSRHREIQLPTAWSNTSITVTLNRGSFPNFTGLYLFVTDDAGNTSAGFPLTGSAPDTTPPTIVSVSPSGSASAPPTTAVTATFSEPINASTISTSTFELRDGSNALVNATVTYDATTRTATLDPTPTLTNTVVYTATVKGGSTGVKDLAGNALAANRTWTFTTSSISGLVAAYSFDEVTGPTTVDQSGNNNAGTIAGATRTPGKHGAGLLFDGTSAFVSIPDAASLDLSGGMTLEAWVNPSNVSGWKTVILKETSNDLAYALYASEGTRPVTVATVSTKVYDYGVSALPLNSWTHLSATYDGSTMRLFVNGSQVATAAATGLITNSTGPLKLGGNAVWGEFFAGIIDDVRVYNRALSAAEIQNDMTTPVSSSAIGSPTTLRVVP